MAKEIKSKIKLQISAGKASPAPPVGPTLGQHGINIGEFVSQFNDRTKDQLGSIIPVELTVYKDRSFSFITKTPPASDLIKKAAGVKKGSSNANTEKAGKISIKKIEEIAKIKLPDLNTVKLESAIECIKGTARSLGIEITE